MAGLCCMGMIVCMMMYQDASDGMDIDDVPMMYHDASDGMNGFSGSDASNVFLDAPDGWNLTHTPAPDGMAHISDDMPFLSYTTFLDESVLSPWSFSFNTE